METVKEAYPELKRLALRLYKLVKDVEEEADARMIRIEGGALAHYFIPAQLADWSVKEALESIPSHDGELGQQSARVYFATSP